MLSPSFAQVGIDSLRARLGNEDLVGLQEMAVYGLKGMAAYAEHALVLGHEREQASKWTRTLSQFLVVHIPRALE